MNTKDLPCPSCGASIPFVVEDLLTGAAYTCPNQSCNVKISMTEESKDIAQNAYNELQSIKQWHTK